MFRVWGLLFTVEGLGLRALGLCVTDACLLFRMYGLVFSVWGLVFRV